MIRQVTRVSHLHDELLLSISQRLIVSSTVNFVGRLVLSTSDGRPQCCSRIAVDGVEICIQQLGRVEEMVCLPYDA